MKITPVPMHMSEQVVHEDVEFSASCPVCLAAAPRRPVGKIQESPEICLLACRACGAVSASHLPTAAFLDSYYKKRFSAHYARYGGDTDTRVTFSAPARFARHISQIIPPSVFAAKERVRILDFGGGDGSLAVAYASLLDRPAHIALVDYGAETAPVPDRQIELVKFESLAPAFAAGPFDLVIASASLEHVQRLKPVIETILSNLAAKGHLYARTPYVVPLRRLLLGRLDFGYPAHLHDLGPCFWNRFKATFGPDMTLIHSRPSIIEVTPGQHFLRWLAAAVLKFPTRLEMAVMGNGWMPLWRFCGGWEVAFTKVH